MSWKLSRTVLRGASDGNTVRLLDDKKGTGARQPYYFYLKDKDVFGFAGLWEEWLDKETGEAVETCTIITTAANEVLEPIQDRSSVILKSND